MFKFFKFSMLFSALLLIGCGSGNDNSKPADTDAESSSVETTVRDGKWGAYNVIDAHGHIGYYKGYDLTVPTLLSNIERFGVVRVMISNVNGANVEGATLNYDEKQTNDDVIAVMTDYPDAVGGLFWAKPENGDLKMVERFLLDDMKRMAIKRSVEKSGTGDGGIGQVWFGMKIHPEFNNYPADSEIVEPYMELCRKYGIAAVFHSGAEGANSDPVKIYNLAKKFPTVPVIMYHSGFFGPHGSAISVVQKAVEAGDANLYLGTGQMLLDGLKEAIKVVGADRIVFGTDAPFFGKEHYEKYEEMMTLLHTELSAEDFAKVVNGNAKKIFKLK